MTMTDPISDMLARIRNAQTAHKDDVRMPSSTVKVGIADILKREGYVEDYEVEAGPQGAILRIALKYGPDRGPIITGLKRVSKPGRRIYAPHDRLPRVLGGLGVAIVSTSKGLMTDRQAVRQKVGGEVVCEVW